MFASLYEPTPEMSFFRSASVMHIPLEGRVVFALAKCALMLSYLTDIGLWCFGEGASLLNGLGCFALIASLEGLKTFLDFVCWFSLSSIGAISD